MLSKRGSRETETEGQEIPVAGLRQAWPCGYLLRYQARNTRVLGQRLHQRTLVGLGGRRRGDVVVGTPAEPAWGRSMGNARRLGVVAALGSGAVGVGLGDQSPSRAVDEVLGVAQLDVAVAGLGERRRSSSRRACRARGWPSPDVLKTPLWNLALWVSMA